MKNKALIFIFGIFFIGCTSKSTDEKSELTVVKKEINKTDNSGKIFELLDSKKTGIDFNNELIETEEINFFKYEYLYNGGGVGIGDINNDNLPDIYFTGTVANDKLYLNQGGMKFKDITLSSGILQNNGLKTGVSFVDINADGLLDIYVCRSGWYENPEERANLLYVNNGDNTFKESAKEFGLAETGHTVQAGFFDYDKDGDLDCYMANHPLFSIENIVWDSLTKDPPEQFRDKLYRNNGDNTFSEVSKEAGINNFGHGLGLVVSDYNGDGWPDVYVANDFTAQDYYYINNKDGSFTEKSKSFISHVSYFAMGSDAADINNDGLLDIFVVEMLAEDNKRQKTNMASMNPDKFWNNVFRGYHYQFMRNTFQLNIGKGSFSEIAYLSGLANTDWSWAPLFADFDHDGNKDLAITNGYLRDTQDKDAKKMVDDVVKNEGRKSYVEITNLLNKTPIKNYVFKNNGDLSFTDKSKDWGFNFSGFSNGMAYGDLDNDGDLDLIVNNFNDPASVYQNTASDRKVGHYLKVELKGTDKNTKGLGSKLTLKTKSGETQFQEFWVVRGFESSVDHKVHFGIAKNDEIEELKIEWPDGKKQIIKAPKIDQNLIVNYTDASVINETKGRIRPYFRPLGGRNKFMFSHKENNYDDYEKELLLPHKQSQNGPKIAVADVNGDQLEDFYIGGAAGQAGKLIIQLDGGQFGVSSAPTFIADAGFEDIGGEFFDADNDGDQDLYVVSGGNEFEANSKMFQDRLYINDGKGNFRRDYQLLPQMFTSGGVVTASDFDNDGDQDLFVGGRLTPGKYPFAPRSYILKNERGGFVDVTETVAEDLMNPGLVTSAIWTDLEGDGDEDLIVIGEWTGVLLFENDNGELINISKENGLDKETGWWNKVIAADIDKDGDEDYILGNLGLNYKYQATNEEPFLVYADDFDENGTLDIVLGYYNDGTCFPVRGRQCSSEQMPKIAEDFSSYEEFGNADMKKVYGEKLDKALHLKATNFASSILINEGNKKFTLKQLPTRAQFAPVNGIISSDFNKDGNIDLLMAGNLFQAEIETGRADAGRGVLLLGKGNGEFDTVSLEESGFVAPFDVKDLALLKTKPNQPNIILVGNNNYGMQTFIENLKKLNP